MSSSTASAGPPESAPWPSWVAAPMSQTTRAKLVRLRTSHHSALLRESVSSGNDPDEEDLLQGELDALKAYDDSVQHGDSIAKQFAHLVRCDGLEAFFPSDDMATALDTISLYTADKDWPQWDSVVQRGCDSYQAHLCQEEAQTRPWQPETGLRDELNQYVFGARMDLGHNPPLQSDPASQ